MSMSERVLDRTSVLQSTRTRKRMLCLITIDFCTQVYFRLLMYANMHVFDYALKCAFIHAIVRKHASV